MATKLFEAAAPDVLYIVDLSSYVLRAYHAIGELRSPSGEPTNAVHGTVNMLERLVREQRPAYLAIAMDSGRATFRRELFPEYKAHRPPAPDDLKQQMARCEQIVRAFAVPILKQEGVEADDLIACAVRCACEHGLRVVIVAADKDLMQLVSPSVILWDTMRERVFGLPEVEERFGVKVSQLRDLFALMGDASDNIPGVPSVGPKTARELLIAHADMDGIFANLDAIKKKGLRETLATHRDAAFLSRKLVTLREDCPISFDLDELCYGGRDKEALAAIYTELGFHRQLQLLEREPDPPTASTVTAAAVVQPASLPMPGVSTLLDRAALEDLLSQARRQGTLVVEPVTSSQDRRGVLVGIALAVETNDARYLPLAHRYIGAPHQISLKDAHDALAPLLGDASVAKIGHGLKRIGVELARAGLPFEGYGFDCELASYLLDPEARHGLPELVQRELGVVLKTFDEVTRSGRTRLGFDQLPIESATEYAALNAAFVARLADRLRPRLADAGLSELMVDVELPLGRLLADLELRGVLVDPNRLTEVGARCNQEIARLEAEAHRIVGRPFNVNSPRQLELLLFDELGLKPQKRTKTARSTDAATLEALAEKHELPRVILEIRQYSKLKSTYIDALPLLCDAKTSRIHCRWEQAVAATGRLSSSDPNLQNIPIRTELGRTIRAAFVAPQGHKLVSADYSQIELRVLAHLSKDPVLVDAFRRGQDIHTRTAMEVFGVPEHGVTREMRSRTKAVNFGIIYGQGESGLSKALGISRSEAQSFITAYFDRYQGVRRFMEETLGKARTGEAVKSLLGRRRLVPDIRSANRAVRLAAERVAMNMPIQGSAADILKLAMLALAQPKTPGVRMILTVHDELVFEVPDEVVERAESEIRHTMESVASLEVPLVVEVGHGEAWDAAH